MSKSSSVPVSAASYPAKAKAFTLVELLVVIGIIALLIAILLPALNRARGAARTVSCLSQQRQAGAAMLMHAGEHQGFLPLVGNVKTIGPTGAVVTPTAVSMGDPSKRRYVFFSDLPWQDSRPMPITASLIRYLGGRVRDNSSANLTADCADPTLMIRKAFACPADENVGWGWGIRGSSGFGVNIYSSYSFNQAVFGWDDGMTGYKQARGQMNRVKRQTETAIMFDALPLNGVNSGYLSFVPYIAPATMAEGYFGLKSVAGDKRSYAVNRHNRKINILFADYHAETQDLPGPNAQYDENGPLSKCWLVSPETR